MSNKNIRLCIQAHDECIKSKITHKHGAIIAKGKKIITKGFNNSRSTFNGKFCLCTHAEIDAITKWINLCCKDTSDIAKKGSKLNLYVVRENFAISQPCQMCTKMILLCNFKKVIYSTGRNSNIRVCKPRDLLEPILTSADNLYLSHISRYKQLSYLIQ